MFGCMFRLAVLLVMVLFAFLLIAAWTIVGGETIIGMVDGYLPPAIIEIMRAFA